MRKYNTSRLQAQDFTEALGLLTRLPVTASGRRGAQAAWAWPLAGVIVALLAGLAGVIALWLGLPASFAAGLVIAVQIVATGAMHEDGLADCADGFWGGWSVDERLLIMKDSQVGTYGVLALVIVVGLRWCALSLLFTHGWIFAPLIASAALSRAAMVAVMGWLPPARAKGLSATTGQPEPETIIMAALVGLVAALLFSGFAALVAGIFAGCAAWLLALLARNRIGGQTGDVLGASQQVSEIVALMAFVIILV